MSRWKPTPNCHVFQPSAEICDKIFSKITRTRKCNLFERDVQLRSIPAPSRLICESTIKRREEDAVDDDSQSLGFNYFLNMISVAMPMVLFILPLPAPNIAQWHALLPNVHRYRSRSPILLVRAHSAHMYSHVPCHCLPVRILSWGHDCVL